MRLAFAALVLTLLPQEAEEVVALKGGRLLTVTKGEIEDGIILIRGGKIAAVGKDVKIPDGARVIELARGSVVAPGFIDAHSHLASAFEVDETTESVTPEVKAIEAFASDHADVAEAAGSGVTVVAIAPGDGNLVGGRVGLIRLNGRRYDRMILKDSIGLKLSFSSEALRFDREPTSRQGAMTMLRNLLRDPKGEVARALLQRGEVALIRASGADDIARAAEFAANHKLRAVLVHADGADEAMDAIRAAKLPVAFGPLRTGDTREKLGTPAKLAKAGIAVAFISDAPTVSEANLRLSAVLAVRQGLDKDVALRALTLAPAEMLGIADRFGSLETGKDADLVVYTGDPLSMASAVETVIVEGRITYQKPKK
jgi:imidazolonepropionase-like amidohydrolase